MKNSFAAGRNPVREALSGFLWDQWIALGVSGSGPKHAVPFVVDPEALLLATTRLAGAEPRLLEEVLTWLICHEQGYPAGIARETGWFSKSVQALLNDLVCSGLVSVQPGERPKHFRLERRAWEAFLVPAGRELAWFPQVPWYEGSQRILETVERIAEAPEASDRLKAIWIRDALPGIESACQAAGQGGAFAGLSALTGAGLVEVFGERVAGWLGAIPGQKGKLGA